MTIKNIIKNHVNEFYNGKKNKENTKMKFILTTYVPGLSERLKKTLHHQYDLTSPFAAKQTTDSIGNIYCRMKYTVPMSNKSKLFYSVKCGQCEKICIGITKQKLMERIATHRSDVHLNKGNETTELTCGYEKSQFRLQQRNDTGTNPRLFLKKHSCIAEKMYKTPNSCNIQIDQDILQKSYINLLQIHSKPRQSQSGRPQGFKNQVNLQ